MSEKNRDPNSLQLGNPDTVEKAALILRVSFPQTIPEKGEDEDYNLVHVALYDEEGRIPTRVEGWMLQVANNAHRALGLLAERLQARAMDQMVEDDRVRRRYKRGAIPLPASSIEKVRES